MEEDSVEETVAEVEAIVEAEVEAIVEAEVEAIEEAEAEKPTGGRRRSITPR